MEQVIIFPITKLHVQEVFGFLCNVRTLAGSTLDVEILKPMREQFNSSVDKLDEALLQDIKNSYTELVKQADEKVDNLYVGLCYHLRGMVRFPNEATASKAKTAYAIVKKYGTITNLNYTEQYGALHNVMQELNELSEEVKTALGLESWLEALTVAIIEFQNARDAQTMQGSQYKVGFVKEARREAEVAYTKLVEAVNALSNIMGDADFKNFITNINYMISEEEAKMKSRDTINAKKNKDKTSETTTEE